MQSTPSVRPRSSERIVLTSCDITRLSVDAIVCAADESLVRGVGVAATIFRAGGAELLRHCAGLPLSLPGVRCRPGSAVLTPGFDLQARHVIHTVGLCYVGGEQGEPEVLANCYRSVLRLARLANLRSLAIPALGCGARRFPIDEAATIAVRTLREELVRSEGLEVTLVAFNAFVNTALKRCLGGSGEHVRGH